MKQPPIYCVVTGTTAEQHAGQKARQDIQTLADGMGLRRLVFHGAQTAGKGLTGKLELILAGGWNWLKLLMTVKRNSLVLFQYPHRPVKSARLGKAALPLIRRLKGIRFAALVHDLDSLRNLHGEGAVYSDRVFLPLFDHIICHNPAMKRHLLAQGVREEQLTVLEIFDYLLDPLPEQKSPEGESPEGESPEGFSLCVAGNLSPEQSGYLYQLIDDPERDYPLHLYGPGFTGESDAQKQVTYHGVFPPDELPRHLEGAYGLVWGGDSAETCTGSFGDYLQYNNPHKLSLYLASGMPVVLWDKAATAPFVREHRLGMTVSGLKGLKADPQAVDRGMLAVIRQQLATGWYFTQAMEKLRRKG